MASGPFSTVAAVMESDAFEAAAQAVLDDAVRASGDTSGVNLERRVICGSATQVMLHEAQGADELVVGARGHGGLAGLLLGSVASQCAHHAPCPVVIIPADSGTEHEAA